MPRPTLAEIGQMNSLSLLKYYQSSGTGLITMGKALVVNARSLAMKISPQTRYLVDQDEVARILNDYLTGEDAWGKFLGQKANLPYNKHAIITDIMARYVAYDAAAFLQITT